MRYVSETRGERVVLPVDAAPVEPEAGLDRERVGRVPPVLDPGAEARRVDGGVQLVRQPGAALHARAVRGVRVAVARDLPGRLRAQAVQLGAHLEEVTAGRHRDLLAQREVAHAEQPRELDVGHREADPVVGRVGPARVGAELRVGAEVVAVEVVGRDRARQHARADRRPERQRGEVVLRVRDEGALLAGAVALEESVGRLAAQETDEGQPSRRPDLPVGAGLEVAERRQVRPDDPVRHEVVVRAPRGDEPRATGAPGQAALERRRSRP